MERAQQEALLEQSERLARLGSWDWDLRKNQVLWSDNLFRLFGYEVGAFKPTRELVAEHIHPDDREEVRETLDSLSSEGESRSMNYRITDADGNIRHLDTTTFAVETSAGRPVRIIGSVQDVTERLHRNRHVAAHFAVSQELAHWQGFDASAKSLLRRLGTALGACVGFIWLPVGEDLVARACWQTLTIDADELESSTQDVQFSRGMGLPGRAWETGEPVALSRVQDDGNPGRRRTAAAAGLEGAIALPAMKGSELLAVVELYLPEEPDLDERLFFALAGISYELGHFLANRRAELTPSVLTMRELEVLRLATEGRSGPDIAAHLDVSPSTVKTHFENLYEKLEVTDRSAAVAHALRTGLIN